MGEAARSERFEGDDVPLPPHWGGYLVAHAFEFWQGRPGRVPRRLLTLTRTELAING